MLVSRDRSGTGHYIGSSKMPRQSMPVMFRDRACAGSVLAEQIAEEDMPETVVVAIPCGGVPVAAAIARRLNSPLAICLMARITFPENPKLSVGTIDSTGDVRLDPYMMSFLSIDDEVVPGALQKSREKLHEMSARMRQWSVDTGLEGKRILIVDDAIATGISMLGAVQYLQRFNPRAISVAAPVISQFASALLTGKHIDHVATVISEEAAFRPQSYYQSFEAISAGISAEMLANHEQKQQELVRKDAC